MRNLKELVKLEQANLFWIITILWKNTYGLTFTDMVDIHKEKTNASWVQLITWLSRWKKNIHGMHQVGRGQPVLYY